jgi:hypothetical protein
MIFYFSMTLVLELIYF